MEPTTSIQLDAKTRAIVERKALELKEVYGTVSKSAAIRNIILEWDSLSTMGQTPAKAQKASTK